MDISESFRVGEEITKPSDLFDFVVNASDNVAGDNINALPQFNRSLKSLGIYLETSTLTDNRNGNENADVTNVSDSNNNNSSNTEDCDKLVATDGSHHKEQNNNHLMIANGTVQYMDGSQSYWSGSTIKDDPVVRWDHSMLEDLNCWNQENGSDPSTGTNKIICSGSNPNAESDIDSGNTDGTIYTLTVLNGSDHGSTWYRLPETAPSAHENDGTEQGSANHHDQLTARPSSVTPSIDFDSLLNNILPNSIHQLTSSSSFPSYLAVNTQDILPSRDPDNPVTEVTSSPIKPGEFLYEDSSYHEGNNSARGTLRISYSSSTDNPSSNHSNNSSCSSNNNVSNNPEWKLTTESNQSPGSSTSDARVSSLLRNALQGKSNSFASRYNGAQVRSHGAHPVAMSSSSSTKQVEKSENLPNTCKEVAASVAATTATVPGFSDMDDSVKTHSPLMAVSLEGGTVVMFDGGQGTGSMLVDSDNPSSAQSMDDIFLSQLDAVSYGEDYEKLKSIENEVAKSVEQYCTNPYFSPSGHLSNDPSRIPSISHHLDHTLLNAIPTPSSTTKNSKKYSKRSSSSTKNNGNPSHNHQLLQNPSGNANSGSAASGIRKERSLHYCTICHKGFKDKYSVNVHVRTHTGEKPFTCTFCGKNFRQKAHLAKHHHTHSVQKTTSSVGSNVSNKPQNSKHR